MDTTLANASRDDDERPGQPRPAPAAGRRCYLSVMFCDLCDSTALSAAREAEHYAEIIRRLRMLYETAVARHRGTVVRIQGDGMLAIFGYPNPREGDGRRATEAALDLHAMVRGLSRQPGPDGDDDGDPWPPLRLHTGIHSGLVLVQQGDLVRGRFELLGNVPNVAAKLSDAAQRDEALISEETLGLESHFFETGPRRLLTVGGRSEPVAAYAIHGRSPVHTRFEASTRRGLSPFIGRAPEMLALESCLDEALAGAVRHVAVAAQAGVGKTRLAHQFLALAARRGCRTLAGYCESELSAEPLQPLLQMLRGLFGIAPDQPVADAAAAVLRRLDDDGLQAHGPELLRMLSLATEPAADGRRATFGDSTAALAAIRALFANLLEREPLVLFIDDWQWADVASNQALAAIRALDGAALLVLLATRGLAVGDATMNDIRIIELPPFSEREAAQSIGELLPSADPFVAAEISRYSGGNALFIEELCHSAAHEDMDRRLVRLHGGAWLSVLVESRVARLPEEQAALVRTAAVIGNVVPAWLLQDLTGIAPDDPLVRGLAAEDFIFPGEAPGTLRFKHGMTRDVVYDAVGLTARRALHLRIAEALRRQGAGTPDEAHEALAYHYGASGRRADAAHHAERAGDKAVAVSALDRAKAQYRAALAALDALVVAPAPAVEPIGLSGGQPRVPPASAPAVLPPGAPAGQPSTAPAATAAARARWLAVANKLGLVCVFDAGRQDLDVFHRAVGLARQHGDGAALARAEYWLGYVHYALGEGPEAIRHCRLALDAVPAPSAGRPLVDGSAIAEADPLTVQIRATLGQAMVAVADYDNALPLLDEAIAVKKRHRSGARLAVGLAYSLVCRACVRGDRGEFALAHAEFDEAAASVRGLTHEIGASIHGWHGAVLLWQGRWDDARRAAAESTRVAEQTRGLYSFCMARAVDAYADWMTTRDPAALLRLRQATGWLEPREGALFRSLNHGWLADGLLTAALGASPAGRPAAGSAAASLIPGEQDQTAGGVPPSSQAPQPAQRREARQHAAQALLRGRSGDLIGVAMACRAMALDAAAAGNRPRAARCIERALQIAAQRGSQHERASTHLCAAEVALAFGDRPHALAALDRAMPAFERMEMTWHLAQAQRLAR